MTTIEQIHSDFDTAVENLLSISAKRQRIADSIEIPQEEKDYKDGIWLREIGFGNTNLAKKASEYDNIAGKAISNKEQEMRSSEKIKNLVQKYQSLFPFHKFILYSQVIQICEKYNLYISPSKFYKGNIPKKNLEELKNFPFDVWEKSGSDYSDHLTLLSNSPICNQSGSRTRSLNLNKSLYICAPLNEFELEKTENIGKEIYEKPMREINPLKFRLPEKQKAPKDPIILLPVIATELNEIGFIVVTKWGKEADDINLQVGINN